MPCKNETWWAENKRQFYLPLLRWQLAETNQTNLPALATSCYELNLFGDWEKQLERQNMVTAREIEKAIRWDGDQFVSNYVEAHPKVKNQLAGQSSGSY